METLLKGHSHAGSSPPVTGSTCRLVASSETFTSQNLKMSSFPWFGLCCSSVETRGQPGMVVAYTAIPALERPRQEDCKSEASLGYTGSHLDSKPHLSWAGAGLEFQPAGRTLLCRFFWDTRVLTRPCCCV